MKAEIKQAFQAVCSGYSPDRVVADPDLNQAFLETCRQLGLKGTAVSLNRALLNLRKQGGLRGLKSKPSTFPNMEQYRFASEMAVRFMERRDAVSLDDIICDPVQAIEFDALAARLAPGYKPVEYRWAALNLRKAKHLKPEILSRVVEPSGIKNFGIVGLELNQVDSLPGLYIFYTRSGVLYIGEAENLNNRIRKHLDHSDNKGLARWLWEQGSEELFLEIQLLPMEVSTRVRKALEMELIRSRNPTFNVKR